ncbi:ATP-dependent Clp protease adaptor protein ClpS [Lachnospiraceae bacterium]|nr:ATP-dependent Clp protease adaptor protein ClpS [Lachnospiraceae bacterium]
MSAQGSLQEKTITEVKEPGRYNVIMYNDDFTTMEFVVEILEEIFHKNSMEAEILMLTVHKSGKAAIGSYPYDIAVSKVNAALSRAKSAGFPFRMTVEEA